MSKVLLPLILFSVFSLPAAHASAGDIYLAQNAAGGANGTACASAQAVSFFNSSSNWGSGANQIGAGTTVHLCGTISSSLRAQGSGAAGNPVTILFEPGAKISQAVCATPSGGNQTTCLDLGSRSYITVDGGSNGMIESTGNGTGLANQADYNLAINARNTSHVEIKNLLIQNMYKHTSTSDGGGRDNGGCVVYYNANNLHIHDIVAHDMRWCFTGNDISNIEIDHAEVYNVDHAISGGANTPGSTSANLRFHDNYFHDYANWDINSGGFHHDGFQIWALSNGGTSGNNGVVDGLYIYNNLLGGNMGVNHTGQVYLMDSITNAYIFNNVIIGDPATPQPVYALIRVDGTPGDNSVGPVHVFNNTVIGTNSGYAMWFTNQNNLSVKNNVVSGNSRLIQIDNSTLAPGGVDNNIYASASFAWNNGSTNSLSTWQSRTGQEANSKVVSNLGVSSTGVPQAGAAVIGAGANLTSVGIAALNSDKAGSPRPSTGTWDAGAYQFGTSATRPAAPTGLTAVVQ